MGMTPQDEFGEFYRRSKDRCLHSLMAAGMPQAAAEDALAESFARAWASWPRVRQHPQPLAWVMRTAMNQHVSWWRRQRREVELDTRRDTPASQHVEPTGREDLLRAVAVLPERQRQVVALRILLDLDTAGTAHALGIATGSVTAHLHRAMTTLRHTFREVAPHDR